MGARKQATANAVRSPGMASQCNQHVSRYAYGKERHEADQIASLASGETLSTRNLNPGNACHCNPVGH